jgi:hypothetical protein
MDKSGSAEEYTHPRKYKPAQQPLYGYYTGFRKYNSIASGKNFFGFFRPQLPSKTGSSANTASLLLDYFI